MDNKNQKIKGLTVFFPAYNEEENIVETVKKAIKVLETLKLDWEIIVVNDGSKDRTREVSEAIAKKYPKNIHVINQPNGGYGAALKTGLYNAKYDWIVYTDSDGQFDFSEVTKFLEKTDTADAIWGYRMKRKDPFFRLIFAKGWALSVFLFFRIWLRDVDCGFKMISKKVLNKIPKLESQRGGMINAELAIKVKKYGFKLAQVGVNHYPRVAGSPTGASIRVIIQSYLDLLKLWLKLH